jgi:hypothetical protein
MLFFQKISFIPFLFNGISLSNALAVTEGWMDKKSAFIRTPKFNITDKGNGVA